MDTNQLTPGLCTAEFYLILDVGVGGTNGWFPDGKEKPWYDGAESRVSWTLETGDI